MIGHHQPGTRPDPDILTRKGWMAITVVDIHLCGVGIDIFTEVGKW
jgi:hypothetical protein